MHLRESAAAPVCTGMTHLALKHWLTFAGLALELDLPVNTKRTLQRKLLGSEWETRLGMRRWPTDDPRFGKPRVPPLGSAPWIMRRDLVVQHRAALIDWLFPGG